MACKRELMELGDCERLHGHEREAEEEIPIQGVGECLGG